MTERISTRYPKKGFIRQDMYKPVSNFLKISSYRGPKKCPFSPSELK